MKNLFITALLALSITGGWSQKQAPEKKFPFTVDGTIRNFTGNKIYLHHKWNEKDHTDSAKVVNGKFVFNLKSVEPNMYWFTVTNDINAQPNYIFFADPTTLTATLIGDSLPYSNVTGGQSQRDYIEYRMMISNLIMIQQRMQADFAAAQQKGDLSAQQAIQAEYQNLNIQFISGLKNFVKTHPASAVSGYIIYNDLNNPNIPLSDVEEALSYVDKSIANTKFIRLATKRVEDKRGTTVGFKATNFSQKNT
jgi:hypothetical protein